VGPGSGRARFFRDTKLKGEGYTLVELLAVLAIAGSGLMVAMPVAQGLYASGRIHSAGQEAAMTFRVARMAAIRSGRETAVRIESDAQGYRLGIYRDGNGNGVLTRDILRGVDPPAPGSRGWDRGDVRVSILQTVPVPDPSSPGRKLDPSDPVRFNSSNLCSFSPLGECTPGSLYLSDGRSRMAVVRVYNRTGRIRVLYFKAGSPRWEES
jgi:prepilin-type N-terminal cleavage/methylation domain-containing protein